MKYIKVEQSPIADVDKSRRNILIGGAALVAGTGLSTTAGSADTTPAAAGTSSNPSNGMGIRNTDTAVVFIDPQNDVLSEKGANWARSARA